MTHLWFAVLSERYHCCWHHSSFSSVFAAHFLIQALEGTSNLQSFIVYFPLSETFPAFKEYMCMTWKARGELKNSSPNRETGKAFILCPRLLTFESCRTRGRCLEEATPKEFKLLSEWYGRLDTKYSWLLVPAAPVLPLYLQQHTKVFSEAGQLSFLLACSLLTRDQKQGGL